MSKTIKILCREVTTEEKLPFLSNTFCTFSHNFPYRIEKLEIILETFAIIMIILLFIVCKVNERYEMSKAIKILCKEITTQKKLPFLYNCKTFCDRIM